MDKQADAGWEALKANARATTIMIPPPAHDGSQQASRTPNTCMLLIMPGAGQAPDSYLPLAKHLSSQASNGSLDLWVAVAGVDTMAASQVLAALDALNTKQPLQAFAGLGAPYSGGVPSSEQLMLQLLQEVVGVCNERSGQVLQRSNTGRYTNLVVAPHSMASMLFADAALMIAGGIIALGCGWGLQFTTSLGWAACSRPVLMVTGQEDGQVAWPTLMTELATSAWTATRQGAKYAATNKGVILIPGLNHGQLSDKPPNVARGDCEPSLPAEVTLPRLAKVMTAFLQCHFGDKEAQGSAADLLLSEAVRTAQYVDIYAQSCGAGSLVSAWEAGKALDASGKPQPNTLSRPAAYVRSAGVPRAHGGYVGQASPTDFWLLRGLELGPLSHGARVAPLGLADQTEIEARELQTMVLQSAIKQGLLPADAASHMSVIVHVHSNLASFLYSQACMTAQGNGRIELEIPAFMHFAVDEKSEMAPTSWHSYSHSLWVKLKSETALAAEARDLLGLEPLPTSKYTQGEHVSAQAMNQHVLDWALTAVTEEQRDRYMKEGVTLACVPDEQVANSAKVWARNSRMAFTPTKDSADGRLTVQVRSPVFAATHGFTFPAPDRPFVPPQSAEDRRFWGPMYVKVLSRAQAVEWVLLGSMRQRTLPDTAGCPWGGYPLPYPQ